MKARPESGLLAVLILLLVLVLRQEADRPEQGTASRPEQGTASLVPTMADYTDTVAPERFLQCHGGPQHGERVMMLPSEVEYRWSDLDGTHIYRVRGEALAYSGTFSND